jgi:putative thioredoxin
MAQAVALFQRGERDAALALAAQAHAADADNARVAVQYLALLLDGDRLDEAEELMSGFSAALQTEPLVKTLDARLALARVARGAPDIPTLEARVAQTPDDLRARIQLAARLAIRENYEPALRELLEVMRRNRAFDDGAAHRGVLKIFELLGDADPLVGRYRRELARLLY